MRHRPARLSIGLLLAPPIAALALLSAEADGAGVDLFEPAAEQPTPEEDARSEEALEQGLDLRFEIEPRLWYAALSADLTFDGGGGTLDSDDRGFDGAEASFLGRIRVRTGDLSFSLAGFAWETDETGAAEGDFSVGGIDVAAGERFTVDLEYDSVEFIGRYEFWRESLEPAWEGGDPVVLRFEAGAGARAYAVDADFAVVGGERRSDDGTWVEPVLSAAFAADLGRTLTIETEFAAGFFDTGDRESSSFDITLRGELGITEDFAALVGYRFVSQNLEDDAFSLEGSLAGLFVGFTLRF